MTRALSVFFRKSLSCLLFAGVLVAVNASAQVGTFEFVIGDVRVRTAAAVERAAVKGGTVNEGDTIISGSTGEAQLRMVDDAFVAIRRNTELRIDQYNYKGRNDGTESGVLNLVKGTFRALTGLIVRANKQNFAMKTAVSTIGIRGTGNITHHDAAANVTTNHTVTGSHSVTSIDPGTGRPIGVTVVTTPGLTVQVQLGQPPRQIPTPSFILAEASRDPKEKKAEPEKKEEAKPAPRTASLEKAEIETRETQDTKAKEEPKVVPPPSPPPPPAPILQKIAIDLTATSTSEQQLLQANLRTQIEGAFIRAQTAAAGLSTLAASAQTAATSAATSAASASALTGVDLTTLDNKIATASSLVAFAPSIQSSVDAAVAQRNTAYAAAGVVSGVLNPSSTLKTAQTAASNAATTASTAASAVPGLVSTANADFSAVQTTYNAAVAAFNANNITLAQQLLETLVTQANTAVVSAGAASSAAGSAQSAAATAASQLSTAQSAVNTANTTVTTAVASVDTAINTALGNVQAVAAAATDAKNQISAISTALGTASGTTAQQAFDAASTTNTTAQSKASSIAGIAAVNTTTASSNLASVTTLANTAQGQVNTATSVNTANSNVTNGVGGTDFRDSQAAAALTSTNTANTAVQGALTSATSSNSTAATQSTNLTTAKSSAVTQSGNATTAFSTATNSATTTFNALTAAAQVDAGATNANQTVSNLLSLATTAANNAQAAANLGTQAGALTAQTEFAKAQAYLALAQQIQTVIQKRDAVIAADGQLATLLSDANAAKSAGDAAVAATTTALSTATTNATTVAQQSVSAQYSNPTIVSANRFASLALAPNNLAANSNERVKARADTQPNTTYVLDGSKNLVEIRDTSYTSTPGIVAPSVFYADANVKFAGGTPFDNFVAFDPSNPNYVALGRWQGGTITADNKANGVGVDHTVTLGPRSAHWLLAYEPPAGYVQNLTGTTTYTKIGNTSPTDASGTVGTLISATLSANFIAQTVNAGVDVTIASKNLVGSATNLPIVGNFFEGGFGSVTCSPSCSYTGNMAGSFAGQNAAGAGFGYNLWPSSDTGLYTDLIQGVVAFSTATPPAIAPKPAANIATAYLYGGTNRSATSFQASGTSYTLDGSGNLTQVSENPLVEPDFQESQTISGGTSPTQGTPVTTTGGTTITYGRWQGGSVSGTDSSGAFGPRTVDGAYHWMKGPPIGPFYLTNALTGTASFTAQGGSVSDQSGTAGMLDLVHSTLSVNFTQQSLAVDIRATTGTTNTWRGFGTGVGLEPGGQFFAFTSATSPHNNMAVEFNGSTAGTSGVIEGTLMGNGADAAGVGFAFRQGTSNGAAGTVAFTGTAQNQSASFVAGIVAAGKLGSPVNTSLSPILGTATLAGLNSELAFEVEPIVNASSRVTRDGASQVTKFDAEIPVAMPTGCTSTSCTGVSHTPGTFTVRDNTYPLDPPPSPGGTTPTTALTDTGSDATTGIRWGRYVGFVSYADRITGTATNPAVSAAAFDARTSNWHAIWVDAQTSKPVLPSSGTVNYTMVGGTRPSDSAGNVATGPATATLSANFTAMTVNTSVNATVGPNTWAANASNVAIVNGTFFQAQKTASGGNLSVTCTGCAAGPTSGKITGVFTGNATGTNGGAMLGYSLNQGGAAGVTMQGVTAFKK